MVNNIDLILLNLSAPNSVTTKKMVGCVYGGLTIISYIGDYTCYNKSKINILSAKCVCGNINYYRAASIRSGTKSCGCLKLNMVSGRLTHGHTTNHKKSKAYSSWAAMKTRCYSSKSGYYHRYGGRGIKVCDRWLNSFNNFLEDMGEPPENHTLDRYPNKDGNYEPGNCRWATPIQQMRNFSRNRNFYYKGEVLCISELEKISSVSSRTIRHRVLVLKWDIEKAITEPPLKGRQTYDKKYK